MSRFADHKECMGLGLNLDLPAEFVDQFVFNAKVKLSQTPI